MYSSKIFSGTIMKCTEYKDIIDLDAGDDKVGHSTSKEEIVKEKAILVRTKEGHYVDVAWLSLLEIAFLYLEFKMNNDETFMPPGSYGYYKGQIFVDEKTIKPYASNTKTISLRKLRNEVKRKH